MAVFSEYHDYDGVGLAELIRSGQVSRREVIDAAIERLEGVNPKINAVTTTLDESLYARQTASATEGGLSGVPFLLKSSAALLEGSLTDSGSAFFSRQVADHDSFITEIYRKSGLVILGRTNMPEAGLNATTEPAVHGPTRNPWNLDLTAGGSSGGAGAAVAAGIVPIAHGTDGAGSIRIPASVNGVFGYKPTRARTPCGPDVGEAWAGLAINHVLTRSVRDNALLLDLSSGMWPGDPYCAPDINESVFDSAARDPKTLRIAFSTTTPNGDPAHTECEKAVKDAATLCQDLGHIVEQDSLPFDMEQAIKSLRLIWSSHLIYSTQLFNRANDRDPNHLEGLEAVTRQLIEEGHQHKAADYLAAIHHVQRTGRQFAPFFDKYDVYLTPTTSIPAWPLGRPSMMDQDVDHYLADLFDICAFTPQFNMSGQPAMSVPLYWTDGNVPVGVQFAGRFGEDAVLFSLAGQLERARPWMGRRPDISANR